MTAPFTESIVEEATLGWFDELGYAIAHGPNIATGEPDAERAAYGDVALVERLRAALARINPAIPTEALEEAVRKALGAGLDSPNLFENNRRFHKLLTDGVDVEYRRADGSIAGDKVWLIDFDEPGDNDWLAVNQFTVVEHVRATHASPQRRPDIVIFVNGLPLGVIELKNAADENATIRGAFNSTGSRISATSNAASRWPSASKTRTIP
jgi:type I restriction enzyme R subunit